jgi:hypothetical protein
MQTWYKNTQKGCRLLIQKAGPIASRIVLHWQKDSFDHDGFLCGTRSILHPEATPHHEYLQQLDETKKSQDPLFYVTAGLAPADELVYM